jgi:hypothetical protein
MQLDRVWYRVCSDRGSNPVKVDLQVNQKSVSAHLIAASTCVDVQAAETIIVRIYDKEVDTLASDAEEGGSRKASGTYCALP